MKIHKIMALVLAAIISLASAAAADDTPTAANLPEPLSPQHLTLADGRIEVYVGTPRVSDYTIGDSIPVCLVFEITPDSLYRIQHPPPEPVIPPRQNTAPSKISLVQQPAPLEWPSISLEGLKMGEISSQPSDLELVAPSKIEEYLLPNGTKMEVVTLYLTTWVTTTTTEVDLSADFMYAVSNLPDGQQPDWKSASTPVLHLGINQSAAPNQTLLIEGDLSDKNNPRPTAAYWLLSASPLFALPLVLALAALALRRVRRERKLTKNEVVWQVFARTFADARAQGGFALDHYRRIFNALRRHLDVLSLDTTQTLDLLLARPDLDHEAVDYVFNRETWFFDPTTEITQEAHARLLGYLPRLVPIGTEQVDKIFATTGALNLPP